MIYSLLIFTHESSSPILPRRPELTETATREISEPMKRRPSFIATAPVVPPPIKKSATVSQGLEEALIIRSKRASGFWVGYQIRSFHIVFNVGTYHTSSGSLPSLLKDLFHLESFVILDVSEYESRTSFALKKDGLSPVFV